MAEVEIKLPYKIPTCYNWQQHATFYHPLYAGSIDGTDLFPHDKAVIRAMLSTYKPNKNVEGDQSKTLFVARLSKDTTQDAIQNIFEKFGELEKCRLIRDFVTGFSRGYAFVEFKRKKDALSAVRETHKMNIDGRQLLVDFECERTLDGWKPRRFGGGFGGRKESGQLRFGGIDRPFRKPIPPQVNHFAQGSEREGNLFKTSQDSRGNRDGGDQQRIGRGHERNHSTRERDHQGYDKDRRGYDRDRKGYKTDHRGDNRGREGDCRGRRGDSRERGNDDDRDRDRRHYKGRDRDYRGHRNSRRDRDDRRRTDRDRHDRDDRYGDKLRHTDKEDSRDTRNEARSESSNSSRDPE